MGVANLVEYIRKMQLGQQHSREEVYDSEEDVRYLFVVGLFVYLVVGLFACLFVGIFVYLFFVSWSDGLFVGVLFDGLFVQFLFMFCLLLIGK